MSRALPLLGLIAAAALAAPGCAMPAERNVYAPAPGPAYYRGGGGDGGRVVRTESVSAKRAYRFSSSRSYGRVRRGPGTYASGTAAPAPPAPPAEPAAATVPDRSKPAEPQPARPGDPVQVPSERMILYTADLVILVFKPTGAVDSALAVARSVGAYLQSSTNTQATFRVPVTRFKEFVDKLCALGEISTKNIRSEDVSQQFFDLQIRLRAAESVVARLQALLEKAKNVEESVRIEQELARLTEKIEQLKGMIRYYEHHATLSTVSVTFAARPSYSVPIQSTWSSPFGFTRSLGIWRMFNH